MWGFEDNTVIVCDNAIDDWGVDDGWMRSEVHNGWPEIRQGNEWLDGTQ